VEWICRSRLRGEVHVREDFLGGLLEHVGDLGEPALQGGADLVQLPPGRRPVRLGEDGPDQSRYRALGVPGELLQKCTRLRCQLAPAKISEIARRNPSWASEITSRTPRNPRPTSCRRNSAQNS
jgi:hypothetical protein